MWEQWTHTESARSLHATAYTTDSDNTNCSSSQRNSPSVEVSREGVHCEAR